MDLQVRSGKWEIRSFLSTKFQVPNTKFQAPSTKFQIPNSKFQIPSTKFQVPNSKFQHFDGIGDVQKSQPTCRMAHISNLTSPVSRLTSQTCLPYGRSHVFLLQPPVYKFKNLTFAAAKIGKDVPPQ